MTMMNLNQIKSAVQNLSSRERVALREYLEEFRDFEDLKSVVVEMRAASPIADWEQVMANVSTAVTETRNAKTHRRVRYQRLRERSHRKTRATGARD